MGVCSHYQQQSISYKIFLMEAGDIKAIFHHSSIIHSICTHLHADERMGEDLQSTKQSRSSSRKQPLSQPEAMVTQFKRKKEHKTNTKCLHTAIAVQSKCPRAATLKFKHV